MASSSQHRCVFVGNIPYDATEEQLVDICREVGPVVSFRLVIDRETGKPKGYGFCEYKDEETALSARRNLQGYEINGRQLRVDFAENDKNTDRNREQGRGGPGLAADLQKQVRGGPAIFGESGQHQPIGLHIAITAATVMAGALGGSQASALSNPHSLQSQSALASDPLTLHLAKMSRSQLNEMISELKAMATQNREAARQLLIGRPQLSKALFQAQIMLGMVTPQVLQMPNIRQPLDQSVLPFLQETQQAQQPAIQILPGLAPLIQSVQSGLVPRMQEGQFSAVPQHSLVRSHLSAPMQHSMQPRIQISQPVINHIPHQAALLGQSGVPPLHPSVRPKIHLANHSSLNQPAQASLLQQRGLVAAFGSNSQTTVPPNPAMQSLLLPRPFTPDASFQPGPSISSGISGPVNKDAAISARIPDNPSVNLQTSTVRDSKEVSSRPSKLFKLDDDKSTSFSMAGSNVSTAIGTGPSEAFLVGSVPPNLAKPEELQYSEKQSSQLTPDMESALLQQVLNLTPEQLNSLPPEQQQQVIQLQQALRGGQLRPS